MLKEPGNDATTSPDTDLDTEAEAELSPPIPPLHTDSSYGHEDELLSESSEHSDLPFDDLDADTVSYHAVEIGAGRCIVMLHDIYTSQLEFAGLTEQLSEDWRCLSLDLPGHGESTPLREGMTLAETVQELAAVLAGFGVSPAVFVGHGSGAILASMIAEVEPSMVDALVLLGVDSHQRSRQSQLRSQFKQWRNDRVDYVDHHFSSFYASKFFLEQPGLAADERNRFSELDVDRIELLAMEIAGFTGLHKLLGDLSQKGIPISLIGGEEDKITPPKVIKRLAEKSHIQTRFVANCGHMMPVEQPKVLAKAIEDCLDNLE